MADSASDSTRDMEPHEIAVTAHGGTNEVGRSCYHVEIANYDVLVDCGIKQSTPTAYPNLGSFDEGEIDGVFITHAHIDHIGALPLLTANNLLSDDAEIIATQPTADLMDILLRDSLKLHRRAAERNDQSQRFTEADVDEVMARIRGRPYGDGKYRDITFSFGNAGHLLGSAWLSLETNVERVTKRVVFSGDLGGRSAHLPDIASPPEADALFLESTYGDRDTHTSFSTARTTLWNEIVDAVETGTPVLIPTFAVGRAQEILQVVRERIHSLPNETAESLNVIYDGMITDSMRTYHSFTREGWFSPTFLNYTRESQDYQPFLPQTAVAPSSVSHRENLLDGEGGVPVIVTPSGMLTGGWSPWYLHKLAENYDTGRILLVGYQAEGTPGRRLHELGDDDEERFYFEGMYSSDGEVDVEFTIPGSWVEPIDGFSGHAARNSLLTFARQVDPADVHLIHGDQSAIAAFTDHLENNLNATVSPAEEGVRIPIQWSSEKTPISVPDATQSSSEGDGSGAFTPEQEERLRELIREEFQQMMLDTFASSRFGDDP